MKEGREDEVRNGEGGKEGNLKEGRERNYGRKLWKKAMEGSYGKKLYIGTNVRRKEGRKEGREGNGR